MDFDQAVASHTKWKARLAHYLAERDGSLNSDVVMLDNQCELGKWIYGEGTRYRALREYILLKREHQRFHKAAAEIVERANAGFSVAEQVQLGACSQFTQASSAVVLALVAMKKASTAAANENDDEILTAD